MVVGRETGEGDDQTLDSAGTLVLLLSHCKHQLTTVGTRRFYFTDRSGLSMRLQQCPHEVYGAICTKNVEEHDRYGNDSADPCTMTWFRVIFRERGL